MVVWWCGGVMVWMHAWCDWPCMLGVLFGILAAYGALATKETSDKRRHSKEHENTQETCLNVVASDRNKLLETLQKQKNV